MAEHVFGLFETQEAVRSMISVLSPYVPHDRISVITHADQLPDYATKQYETDSVIDGTLVGAAIGGVLGLGAALTTALYPTATMMAITLGPWAGASYGFWSGGMLGGLIDLGVSPPNAQHYHDQVERGMTLLSAEVTDENKGIVRQLFLDHGADAVLTR
ncbi:MAG: hypothetical protein WCC10_09835 [Tumebacillaceae bacterium]